SPRVEGSAEAHPIAAPSRRLAARRLIADRPHERRNLEMAVVRLVANVRGGVGHVLNVAAQAVGGDVGERLVDAPGRVPFVGQWNRHPRARPPLIDPTGWSLEIDEAWPRGCIHEHCVLLAHAEVAVVDEGMPQPERVSSPARGLAWPVEEV